MAGRKVKKLPKGFYWVDGVIYLRTDPITHGKKSTGTDDPKLAQMFREQRQTLALQPAAIAAHSVTVGQALDEHLAAKKLGKVTPKTIEFVEGKLKPLRRILKEETRLDELDPGAFDRYALARAKENGKRGKAVSGYTIRRELRELVAALRRQKRAGRFAGELEELVPEELQASANKVDRALSEEECSAFLRALPNSRWRAFVATSVALGLRKSEILKVRRDDIETRLEPVLDGSGVPLVGADGLPVMVRRMYVHVAGTKTKLANRIVPVLDGFAALLKYAEPELPLLQMGNEWRTFKQAAERAGIAHCSPNDLRRSWTTICGSKGVTDEYLAKILGHASVTMARTVYNQTKASQLAPVVEGILARAPAISIQLPNGERTSPGRKPRRPEPNGSGEAAVPTVVETGIEWQDEQGWHVAPALLSRDPEGHLVFVVDPAAVTPGQELGAPDAATVRGGEGNEPEDPEGSSGADPSDDGPGSPSVPEAPSGGDCSGNVPKTSYPSDAIENRGAPRKIRTCDLWLRRPKPKQANLPASHQGSCTSQHQSAPDDSSQQQPRPKNVPPARRLPADADQSSSARFERELDAILGGSANVQISDLGSLFDPIWVPDQPGLEWLDTYRGFCDGVARRNEERLQRGLEPLCRYSVSSFDYCYLHACELPEGHGGDCQAHDLDGQLITQRNLIASCSNAERQPADVRNPNEAPPARSVAATESRGRSAGRARTGGLTPSDGRFFDACDPSVVTGVAPSRGESGLRSGREQLRHGDIVPLFRNGLPVPGILVTATARDIEDDLAPRPFTLRARRSPADLEQLCRDFEVRRAAESFADRFELSSVAYKFGGAS